MSSKGGSITVSDLILTLTLIHSVAAAFYSATAPEIIYSGRRYLEN